MRNGRGLLKNFWDVVEGGGDYSRTFFVSLLSFYVKFNQQNDEEYFTFNCAQKFSKT